MTSAAVTATAGGGTLASRDICVTGLNQPHRDIAVLRSCFVLMLRTEKIDPMPLNQQQFPVASTAPIARSVITSIAELKLVGRACDWLELITYGQPI